MTENRTATTASIEQITLKVQPLDLKAMEHFGAKTAPYDDTEEWVHGITLTLPDGWSAIREVHPLNPYLSWLDILDEKNRVRAHVYNGCTLVVEPFYSIDYYAISDHTCEMQVRDANSKVHHTLTFQIESWMENFHVTRGALHRGWRWLQEQGIDHRNLVTGWD